MIDVGEFDAERKGLEATTITISNRFGVYALRSISWDCRGSSSSRIRLITKAVPIIPTWALSHSIT